MLLVQLEYIICDNETKSEAPQTSERSIVEGGESVLSGLVCDA